jgi:uncharacterized protein (DUF433 family)
MAERATVEIMPIVTGGDGVIRISGTRVPIETVIAAFRDGATPEEIAQQYPSIPLGDLYEVIEYYLRHEADLSSYLRDRFQNSEQTRSSNEARWAPDGIRSRLLARRPASHD